jgi:CTP-dependent riboflavin kinase
MSARRTFFSVVYIPAGVERAEGWVVAKKETVFYSYGYGKHPVI